MMRALILLFLLLLTGLPTLAETARMISVLEDRGTTYVAAEELERIAGIAVKPIAGGEMMAVCTEDRCAPIKRFIRKDDAIWVETSALARILGLSTEYSADRKRVRFVLGEEKPETDSEGAKVGTLAPNFRLTLLDGRTISLADYRGKRVLIQSWASW